MSSGTLFYETWSLTVDFLKKKTKKGHIWKEIIMKY